MNLSKACKTFLAVIAALLIMPAGCFAAVDFGESIYGIYNWKKGGAVSLAAVLSPGSSDDWFICAAADYGIEDDYQGYLAGLETYVAGKYASEGGLDRSKATEWHRTAITVSALGGDPSNFGGVDLIKDGIYQPVVPLDRQGVNGLIWAAIAAVRCGAESSENGGAASICEKLLERQNPDGGFSLRGASDPDVTAMAVRALGSAPEFLPYARLALAALKGMQNSEGGFSSYGTENCESTAQAVLALCFMGEEPGAALDRLMAFQNPDGGFAHIIGGESDSMASCQAMEALIAVQRLAEANSKPEMQQPEAPAETVANPDVKDKPAEEKVPDALAQAEKNAPVSPAEEPKALPDATAGKEQIPEEPASEEQVPEEPAAEELVDEKALEEASEKTTDEAPSDKPEKGSPAVYIFAGAAVLAGAVLALYLYRKRKAKG